MEIITLADLNLPDEQVPSVNLGDATKRAELQTFLIAHLPEGVPRDYATYLSKYTEDWIQAFGDIHAGHPDKAVTLMMKRGSGVLHAHVQKVLPPDGALRGLYDQAAARPDMMIALGQAIACREEQARRNSGIIGGKQAQRLDRDQAVLELGQRRGIDAWSSA